MATEAKLNEALDAAFKKVLGAEYNTKSRLRVRASNGWAGNGIRKVQNEEYIKCANDGMTPSEAARFLNVHLSRIYQVEKEIGIQFKRRLRK